MRVALEGGMKVSELARAVAGQASGEGDIRFDAIGTDTRDLQAGDLFFALRGPNFDAHAFLDQARDRGGVAAVVDRDLGIGLPVVRVDDTRLALGRLAAHWRQRFDIPVIGVTGSNGKTTVREMLASILSCGGDAGLVTRGNLNNDVGMPLTLLGLTHAHRYAVIEMGASAPGDIDYLTRIASPTAAVITNAAPAHLEGFGDIAGVARAKGEIFNGLGDEGAAVLNVDDPRVGLWRVMAGTRRAVSFGLRHPADVTASDVRVNEMLGSSFTLHTPAGEAAVTLGIAGQHNVMNALAAAATAYAAGIDLAQTVRGLQAVRAVERRLQVKVGVSGVRVIDDTYNANPGSVKAALEVLVAGGKDGHRILVLGDMGELGNAARALHEQVGRQARVIGVDRIFAVGELACSTAGMFGTGGRHFATQQELIAALYEELAGRTDGSDVTVLVKGSRSMHMENVVDAITTDGRPAGPSTTAGLGGAPSGKYHTRQMRFGG